ncbi:DUF551 domain-containing protein [Escherichia coli]|nr:DUF551 domain-containing protein [Escherichia coli]
MTTPITKEQLTEHLDYEILPELIDFRRTTAAYHVREGNKDKAAVHKLVLAGLIELQERRKAVMDAEPIYQVWDDGKWCDFGERLWRELYDEDRKSQFRIVYAAPPAPVVPDDVSGPLAHAYKELTPTFMRNHIAVFERYGIAPNDSSTVIQALRIALDGIERRAAMLQAGNSPVIPESCSAQFGNFQHYWHSKGYVMVPKEPTEAMCDISHIGVDVYCGITDDNEYYSIGGAEAAKVWKAMLASAPQQSFGNPEQLNSPVIPDGWVKCSERMPETHTPVWCFGSIPEVSGKEFGFEGWLTTGGFVAENNSSSPGGCEKAIVTHWMPLPAAPQQEGSDAQ